MPNALTLLIGGVDITTKVDMTTVVMQLAGSQETATCEYDIIDTDNTVVATDEATTSVTEVSSATVLFGGFVRSRRITVLATGRIIHIMATDYNSLLDRAIVVSDKRVAGESDKARLTYLMTTYGPQFSSDFTQMATLNASMVAQKFIAITLRQAIERVLGQASTKSSYFVDPTGRLHTYDRTVVTAAPFNVRVGTPLGGELAPEEFSVDNDASNLANAIYIVGATAAGSGWFTDTTSISTYGRRERFYNAPDSDTAAKAKQLGLAVLADQKNPVPRGVFTTKSPSDGWRIGQSITVTSTQHGLAGVSYRIARVTVHYLSGAGDREYSIELGAPQVSMPALLSAAHGGGGGFPWHSPGGTGGWGPVIGSGTTGGGISGGGNCACNTPYSIVIFDDFNARTVSPGGWGTSSFGTPWVNTGAYNGSAHSVSGGKGIVAWSVGSPSVNITGVNDPWRAAAAWTLSFTFTTGSFGASLAIWQLNLTGEAQLTFTVQSAGQWQLSGDTTGTQAMTFAQNTAYSVKWMYDATGLTMSAKVWKSTDPEPDWQQTGISPATPYTAPTVFYWECVSKTVAGTYTQTFDDITFLDGAGLANSGSPVPWTDLGLGNSVQTAFSTLTPFRPGSLETRVGSNPVTPSAQTPTTGAFTLPFPPSGIEHVWAKWVVA